MRQIKAKNYVLTFLLFILTIIAVLFIKRIYENREAIEVVTNDRMDVLSEIKENDLKSYVVENRKIIIYASYSSDFSIENFESQFREYIINHELTKEIVYLNLSQVGSKFYDTLKDKYFIDDLKKVTLPKGQANMYAFENGKIVDILYRDSANITLNDAITFLQKAEQE